MNNPTILAFLQEFISRLKTKNPKFFNILNIIAMVAFFISGLPTLLTEWGINIPDAWENMYSKVVTTASIVVLIWGNLATQRTVVNTTVSGNNTLKTEPDKLPFTAAVEKKEAVKAKEE